MLTKKKDIFDFTFFVRSLFQLDSSPSIGCQHKNHKTKFVPWTWKKNFKLFKIFCKLITVRLRMSLKSGKALQFCWGKKHLWKGSNSSALKTYFSVCLNVSVVFKKHLIFFIWIFFAINSESIFYLLQFLTLKKLWFIFGLKTSIVKMLDPEGGWMVLTITRVGLASFAFLHLVSNDQLTVKKKNFKNCT